MAEEWLHPDELGDTIDPPDAWDFLDPQSYKSPVLHADLSDAGLESLQAGELGLEFCRSICRQHEHLQSAVY